MYNEEKPPHSILIEEEEQFHHPSQIQEEKDRKSSKQVDNMDKNSSLNSSLEETDDENLEQAEHNLSNPINHKNTTGKPSGTISTTLCISCNKTQSRK